jgi:hypothetical protein
LGVREGGGGSSRLNWYWIRRDSIERGRGRKNGRGGGDKKGRKWPQGL